MIADLTLSCTDCGTDFVFSVEEQEFFQGQGFKSAPRRCLRCRKQRKAGDRSPAREARARARKTHPATCSGCGTATQVPFVPDPARPTFCRACYSSRRVH